MTPRVSPQHAVAWPKLVGAPVGVVSGDVWAEIHAVTTRYADALHRLDRQGLHDRTVRAGLEAIARALDGFARTWHEADYAPLASQLLDLTRPDFLHQCANRRTFVIGVRQLEDAVCTRRAGHTGRHAAGNGYTITAVWED